MVEKLGITPGPWKITSLSEPDLDNFVIAAAPEMLDALIDIAMCDFEDEEDHKYITDIIEKATGRTWAEVKELIDESN